MVDCQVEQGNEADVSVFQENPTMGKIGGGFSWSETKEGRISWDEVINGHRFDYFFAMSPKIETCETEELKDETKELNKIGESQEEEISTHVYYRGDPERGDEIISELEKLGGTNNYGGYNGKCDDNLYFLDPISKQIRQIETDINLGQGGLILDLLESFYTEKFLPEPKPETIEIDGKTYDKSEVLDKIKELKEV